MLVDVFMPGTEHVFSALLRPIPPLDRRPMTLLFPSCTLASLCSDLTFIDS